LRTAGADVSVVALWKSYILQDREVISGQNPFSDEALLKLLKARKKWVGEVIGKSDQTKISERHVQRIGANQAFGAMPSLLGMTMPASWNHNWLTAEFGIEYSGYAAYVRVHRIELLRFLGHFEAGFGAFEIAGYLLEFFFGCGFGEIGFGALFGGLGAADVDFLSALRGLRKDGHFVGQNFGKSPCDRQMMSDIGVAISDLADGKFGDQGRVAGKHA